MNYKGTDENMRCRGFQFEVGKEYEEPAAELCASGFHSCEYPLDVFNYYPPATSRYFEVEPGGEIVKGDGDTKVASTRIKIGAEIGIPGLVKAAIEYTKFRAKPKKGSHATGYQGAASATGNLGAASATGYQGAASATGDACVAISCGIGGKARGSIGSAICVVERGDWDGKTYPIKAIKAAIVDGKTIKADTYYTLIDEEFVEAKK